VLVPELRALDAIAARFRKSPEAVRKKIDRLGLVIDPKGLRTTTSQDSEGIAQWRTRVSPDSLFQPQHVQTAPSSDVSHIPSTKLPQQKRIPLSQNTFLGTLFTSQMHDHPYPKQNHKHSPTPQTNSGGMRVNWHRSNSFRHS
jgi:hypothetical protein